MEMSQKERPLEVIKIASLALRFDSSLEYTPGYHEWLWGFPY